MGSQDSLMYINNTEAVPASTEVIPNGTEQYGQRAYPDGGC